MKKALIFEGKIVQIEDAVFPVAPALVWIDAPADASMETHIFDGGAIVVKPASPTIEQATNVRLMRNAKLADSDWTQIADCTADKAAWATYRQALRDISLQAGFPVLVPVQLI